MFPLLASPTSPLVIYHFNGPKNEHEWHPNDENDQKKGEKEDAADESHRPQYDLHPDRSVVVLVVEY